MFVPVGDENPRERIPFVTLALIGLNALLFFLWCWPEPVLDQNISHHALYPLQVDWTGVEWWKDIFTSMFMHANLLHLAGNMIFLWIFGDNVEDKLGRGLFLVFYLACGVAADALFVAMLPNSKIPTLGASGAVSGVLGAYVIFFPLHRVRLMLWIFIPIAVYRIPAFWWIGFWFAQQILFAHFEVEGVAWYAHIGGFLAGFAVALPWKIVYYKTFKPRPRDA
jgi:membrane associated rhomboid family serine protease